MLVILTSYLIARVDLLRNSASLSGAYSNNIVKYNVSANTLKDNIICNWLMIIQLEHHQIIFKLIFIMVELKTYQYQRHLLVLIDYHNYFVFI